MATDKNLEKQSAVKDYIREHRGASPSEVMKNVGVSRKFLSDMETSGAFGKSQRGGLYPCAKCGKLITHGVYCRNCFVSMRSEVKNHTERESVLKSDAVENEIKATSVIMIIDADEMNLQIMKFILAKEYPHYSVLTASSMLSAINFLRNRKANLILLDDKVSSNYDGLEILRRIRKETESKTSPVIMMSAKISRENLAETFTLGISDYIVKPCEPQELTMRVGKVFSKTIFNNLDQQAETQPEMQDVTYKILLVEDKLVDMATEEISLQESFSCEVIKQPTAIDALYYLNENAEVDLILVKLNLPFMDGTEFLKMIGNDERLKRIPAFVMTESKTSQVFSKIEGTVAKGFVTKPKFSMTEIAFLKDAMMKK